MPRAILVNEDNLDMIMLYGAELGLNLSYVADNYRYGSEYANEHCYLIIDGSAELNNATSTMFIEEDFLRHWQFRTLEDPTQFVEIVRT